MNDFQMPGKEEKAEFVRKNFDIISGKYDLFNDLNTFFLHRHWKNTVASLVESSNKGKRITCMDLCCGTGDISLRLNKIPSSEKVYAVDFSDKMLDIARHRLTEFKDCSVQQGDAIHHHQHGQAALYHLRLHHLLEMYFHPWQLLF